MRSDKHNCALIITNSVNNIEQQVSFCDGRASPLFPTVPLAGKGVPEQAAYASKAGRRHCQSRVYSQFLIEICHFSSNSAHSVLECPCGWVVPPPVLVLIKDGLTHTVSCPALTPVPQVSDQ